MSRVSAVELGIARDLLVAVCDEMGTALERAAPSVNIKERRDFSIAIFDGAGRCLVVGDHMPVHLGSMPLAMDAILAEGRLEPGDVAIVNDPFAGGTHLPDITMAQAVWSTAVAGRRGVPAFHVACRAHHADVGGMAPGSMPLATEIFQEGIRIPPLLYVRRGRRVRELHDLLLANVRTPVERAGDLAAQRACLDLGARRLLEIEARVGGRLQRIVPELIAHTARATAALLRRIPAGRHAFEDALDDDGITPAPVAIRGTVELRRGKLVVDLRRSDPQVRGSVNCSRAVTLSAVAYVLRCLLDADVPMNAGTLAGVQVLTTPGSVVDARAPAAVCGGNVETSQRIVDVLLGALARALPAVVPAASQGTMNNLAFGGLDGRGEPYTFYETIGGGAGASSQGPGRSGVHSHMTNSRNTPVEVMERLFPVRVRHYGIRRGSGGSGARPGGDGLVREIELLASATVTLLSDRRRLAPWGLAGGASGRPGRNTLRRAGKTAELPGKLVRELEAGDVLRIETPGGGGHGRRSARRSRGATGGPRRGLL